MKMIAINQDDPAVSRRKMMLMATALALVIATVLALLAPSKIAHAAGGVGSGGTGSGGTGAGHQATYGYGWVKYPTSGPGPRDGFRNGTSWASAQSTCQSANANTVMAFIVYDSRSYGMIYSYQGWNNAARLFVNGTPVDGGRATAISIATAQAAFNSLPSYGVDTSGYGFSNGTLGWFCYDFAPPPPTDVCPNIPGNQASVPAGMHKDGAGNCVSDVGNARLTINTAGIPSGASVPFTTLAHSVGDCGTSFSVNGSRGCVSTSPNGIGWHDHGGGAHGGSIVRAPATVSYGGVVYTFSGWSGGNWSDGGIHCSGLTSRDRCINIAPPSGSGTSSGSITANFTAAIPTCNGASTIPALPESNTNFIVRVSFRISGSGPAQPGTVRLNAPGLTIPAPNPQNGSYGSSTYTVDFSNVRGPSGKYAGNYQVNTAYGNLTCDFATQMPGGGIEIVDKPYFQVRGGDIIAGSGVGTGCSPAAGQQIIGQNTGTAPYNGANTSHASSATGTIVDFASAALNASLRPRGLAFANTAGTYGGNYGGSDNCRPTYDNNLPAAVGSPGAMVIGGGSDVRYSGSVRINGGVASGSRAIFVDGDIYITSNIVYAGGGSWANQAAIPSLYIIARSGNIYIDPNVTQLDGVYVAFGNGTSNGKIVTCQRDGVALTEPFITANCNNSLVVNGAFMAQRIKLLRFNGTLSTGTVAERFNFGPEMWLATPPESIRTTTQPPYLSITSLPPVL